MTTAGSPAIKKELAAEQEQAKALVHKGVPAFFYGRHGGPLKVLSASSEEAPAAFEGPINRLLHNTGHQCPSSR